MAATAVTTEETRKASERPREGQGFYAPTEPSGGSRPNAEPQPSHNGASNQLGKQE